MTVSAIYIGKSMVQISESLHMFSDMLVVRNRKDLRCFICHYNLTQLISRFAWLYLKESKCSKQKDGNFTNNLTQLILFTLFHDYWIYRCVGCMDAPLKQRIHY